MNEAGLMEIIFCVSLGSVVGVFGLATNLINIIIFFKQGFNDSVNISFCALAISDLGSIIPLLWKFICFNPLFQYSDITFNSVQVQYISAAWPHGCFIRITSWITAFVTVERCICISLPMKVKDIITPKRTLTIIVVIFIIIPATVVPVFCQVVIAPIFNNESNKTIYEFRNINNGIELENISFSISVFEQISSFIIIIVCTVVLIHNLITVSQWRQKSRIVSSSNNIKSVSSRDTRIIKMITAISCIFIACLLPGTVNMILVVLLFPDYRLLGRYQSAYRIAWAVISFLEAVNTAGSILVYYYSSSKFRTSFYDLFRARPYHQH